MFKVCGFGPSILPIYSKDFSSIGTITEFSNLWGIYKPLDNIQMKLQLEITAGARTSSWSNCKFFKILRQTFVKMSKDNDNYKEIIIAGAVSETWFALGVQALNYIFVIREQYQTKPVICTPLILKIFFLVFIMSMG